MVFLKNPYTKFHENLTKGRGGDAKLTKGIRNLERGARLV